MFKVITYTSNKSQDGEFDGAGYREVGLGWLRGHGCWLPSHHGHRGRLHRGIGSVQEHDVFQEVQDHDWWVRWRRLRKRRRPSTTLWCITTTKWLTLTKCTGKALCSYLIGKGGSEMKHTQKDYQVKMYIPRGSVNSTPTNTARAELHSMTTFLHANTRGSRAGRLRIAHLCAPNIIVIHVSCLIPCRTCTDHKHKFSLTHLIYSSYLSDSLTSTHKIYDPWPMYTLRCSTAEWRINTNPISHRLGAQIDWDQSDRAWSDRAQKNRAWQESRDRSVSNTGKIYEK